MASKHISLVLLKVYYCTFFLRRVGGSMVEPSTIRDSQETMLARL